MKGNFKLVIFVIITILMNLLTVNAFAGGDGSSSNPYQVSDCTELQSISALSTSYYIQINSFGCSGTLSTFSGNYDGQGYTISGVSKSASAVGGFANFLYGTVKNLYISSPSVSSTGSGSAGGVVGSLESGSLIENVHVLGGSISGAYRIGGIAGRAEGGTIRYSSSSASVYTTYKYAGGAVGQFNSGTIENSFATGSVSAPAYPITGDCGSFIGDANAFGGGIVRYNYGTGSVSCYREDAFIYEPLGCSYSYYNSGTVNAPDYYCGVGISSANFGTQSSFTGFDFTNVWYMGSKPELKKGDGFSCSSGTTCQSGSCIGSRCLTENSVQVGNSCFSDDQCNQSICLDSVCSPPKSNGESCSSDSECTSSNCRKEINSSSYYCAASGNECSQAGGSGFEEGSSQGAYICDAEDSSKECTAGTVCDTYNDKYCTASQTWASGNGSTYVCASGISNYNCVGETIYTGYTCNGLSGTNGQCNVPNDPHDKDESSTYCSYGFNGCTAQDWLGSGTGTNSPCCGDDGTADSFEQTEGATRSACLEGTKINDASTWLDFLVSDGQVYSCNNKTQYTFDTDHNETTPQTAVENKFCSVSGWTSQLSGGNACLYDAQCSSGYCKQDYDTVGYFCADSSTSCVHNDTSYASGTVIDYRWTCNSGTWVEDNTPPNTPTVNNVAGDISPDTNGRYWENSNDGNTIITLQSNEIVNCRISNQNSVYDSMSNNCVFNSINDIKCTIPALAEGTYTYYVNCKDQAGNNYPFTNNRQIQFGIDYSSPTTTVTTNSNLASVLLPGVEMQIDESDNLAPTNVIQTYECHTGSTCTPSTTIDHLNNITISTRGTNYLRWYSTDGAGNSQTTQSQTITVNSLPTVSDTGYFLGDGTGKTGSNFTVYCDLSDSNGAINNSYSVKLFAKTKGSATWNVANDIAMTYQSSNRFIHTVDIGSNYYGTQYEIKCIPTDNLGEAGNEQANNAIFNVTNSKPSVTDIIINASFPVIGETVKFICNTTDEDIQIHNESNRTVYFSLRRIREAGWPIFQNKTMNYSSDIGHYVEYTINEEIGSRYTAQCVASDKIENSTVYQEYDIKDEQGYQFSVVSGEGASFAGNSWNNYGYIIVEPGVDYTNTLKVKSFAWLAWNNGDFNSLAGNGQTPIRLGESGETRIEWDYDFTGKIMDLSTLGIVFGVRGIRIEQMDQDVVDKNITFQKFNSSYICVKDEPVVNFNEVSFNCKGANETTFTKDECLQTTTKTINGNQITCLEEDSTHFKLTGLKHSAFVWGDTSIETYNYVDSFSTNINGSVDQGQKVILVANYSNVTNTSNPQPISGASCNVTIDGTAIVNQSMDYNSPWEYYYNYTPTSPGNYNYTIVCDHSDFATLSQTNNFTAIDTVKPKGGNITGITDISSSTINVSFTITPSTDFAKYNALVNGSIYNTTTNKNQNYFIITGLNQLTTYNITIQTVDTSNNSNYNWTSHQTIMTAPASGDGSISNPYIVNDCEEVVFCLNYSGSLKLNKTIDCSGTSFNGLAASYNGLIDGSGFNLKNIYIESNQANTGLIRTTSETEIKNITFDNLTINSTASNVGIVGSGNVIKYESVTVNGNLYGNSYVGGLVGTGTTINISDSVLNINVTATGDFVGSVAGFINSSNNNNTEFNGVIEGNDYVGGMYGQLQLAIINLQTINSKVTGNNNVGGVFGLTSSGHITNSIVDSIVTGAQYIGGIVGKSNQLLISKTQTTTNVTASGAYAGGLAGDFIGNVTQSYSEGSVSGAGYVGGLIGKLTGYINDTFSNATVSSTGANTGGLIGYIQQAIIRQTYAVGAVSGPIGTTGGLVGANNIFATLVYDSYYDNQTTGQTTSAQGYANTTINLQTKSTYKNWNFVETWNIIQGSYPWLRTFQVDTTKPTINSENVNPASPRTYEKENTTFEITASDASGIHGVYINISNELIEVPIASGKYTYKKELGVGSYSYNWIVYDNINNNATTTQKTYVVNKQTVSGTSLLNDGISNVITEIDSNVSLFTNSSIDQNYLLTINGNSNLVNGEYETNITTTTVSNYTINIYYADNQNYTGFNITRNISFVDTTQPTINSETVNPVSPATYEKTNTTFVLNTTDLSGINLVQLNISGNVIQVTGAGNTYTHKTELAAGSYPYNWTVYDNYGNQITTPTKTHIVNKKTITGTLLLNSNPNNITIQTNTKGQIFANSSHTEDYYITIQATTNQTNGEYEKNISTLTVGNYTVNAYYAGNSNYSGFNITRKIVFIDTIAPNAAKINSISDTNYSTIVLSLNQSNAADFSNYQIKVNGTTAHTSTNQILSSKTLEGLSANTKYNISITTTDLNGNMATNWTLHTTLPVPIESVSNLTANEIRTDSVTIKFNKSNSIAFANYKIFVNGTLNATSTNETKISYLIDGLNKYTTYNITVQNSDGFGQSANKSILFSTPLYDNIEIQNINGITVATFNGSSLSNKASFQIVFNNNISKEEFELNVSGKKIETVFTITDNKLDILPTQKMNELSNGVLWINVTDEYNQNIIEKITFSTLENDVDNDGLGDSLEAGDRDGDGLIDPDDDVNGNQVFSNVALIETIDGNAIQGINYTGNKLFEFVLANNVEVAFNKNMTTESIDLDEVSVIYEKKDSQSYVLTNGISNTNKTILMYHANGSENDICIIDESNATISEMTRNCSGAREEFITCNGTPKNGYVCNKNLTSNMFNITGINNTLIYALCSESWTYSSWSSCSGSIQTRTATDSNSCGTTFKQEALNQTCTVSSGGGGGGGSRRTTTITVTPVEEETVEPEEEKEIQEEEVTEAEETQKETTEEVEKEVKPTTENQQGGGSDKKNICNQAEIPFDKLTECGLTILVGRNQPMEGTEIIIQRGQIYYDKDSDTYYFPKDIEFSLKNNNGEFKPNLVFESGLSLQSRASEFIIDYTGKNMIMIVKKGEMLIKKLQEVVEVIESGNAFISSIIQGERVITKVDPNKDIDSILKDIKEQLKDTEGDISVFIIQDPKDTTTTSSNTTFIVFVIGVVSLGIFSFMYFEQGLIQKYKLRKTNTIESRRKTSTDPINNSVEKSSLKRKTETGKGAVEKPTIRSKLADVLSTNRIQKPIKVENSEIQNLLYSKDSISKLDELYIHGKITKSDYEKRLRKLLREQRK